jgi:hypothetical protein
MNPGDTKKLKRRPRKGVPDQLAEAFLEDCLKRIDQYVRYTVAGGHYQLLLKLDPKVAKAAVKAFRTPEGAAFWMIRGAKEFGGRVPLEVVSTPEGATEVVSFLLRMNRHLHGSKRPL